MERSRALDELLKENADYRSDWLALRPRDAVANLLREWASDPELQLEDVMALAEPHRGQLGKLIIQTGRVFYVMRNPDYTPPAELNDELRQRKLGPCLIEKGFAPRRRNGRGGERLYQPVDKPTQLNAQRALTAMNHFGQNARLEWDRGRLKQLAEREFLALVSGSAAADQLQVATSKEELARKQLEEAQAKLQEAEARAARLEAELQARVEAEAPKPKKGK